MLETSKEANPQEENSETPVKVIHPMTSLTDTKAKEPEPVVVVERKSDVRYNGFQKPFHPLQVLSWFVFFFDFLTYYLINMVSLVNHSLVLVVICSLLYLALSITVLYYAIKATKVDPSDPVIYEQRLVEAQG